MLLWSVSAFDSLYEFNDTVQRSGWWFLLANMQPFSVFLPNDFIQALWKIYHLKSKYSSEHLMTLNQYYLLISLERKSQNLLLVNETQDWHCHLSARADRICFYPCLNAATYNPQFALSSAHVWGCFCVINVFQLLSNKKLLPCSRDINPYLSPL